MCLNNEVMKNLKLYIFIPLFFLITSCSSLQSQSETSELNPLISSTEKTQQEMVFRIGHLHQININDIDGLTEWLQFLIYVDALALYYATQEFNLSDEEIESIYSALRLMSVQHEKYPVAEWNENKELLEIFEAVQKDDPKHTELLRSKNWNKGMWVD